MRLRINFQKSHPTTQPAKNPTIVRRENSKAALPPIKSFIERAIAPKIPNESEVPRTIIRTRVFSCGDGSGFSGLPGSVMTEQLKMLLTCGLLCRQASRRTIEDGAPTLSQQPTVLRSPTPSIQSLCPSPLLVGL